MTTYSQGFDVTSFFVSKDCLKDDIAEYEKKETYTRCYQERARVGAIVGAIIVVLIAAFLFWSSTTPGSEIPAYYGGITLGVGLLIMFGYYMISGRMADKYWDQHEGEMDLLIKAEKVRNPSLSDEDALILARDKQRDLKQQERLYRAQQQQADAQSRMAGSMATRSLFGRR